MTTANVASVLSFRKALRSCTLCELSSQCNGPVPWYGDVNPDICIVGEAPGQTEDKEGQPFVGSAGQLIRQLLRQASIDPESLTWLNAVSCFPRGTPTYLHRQACLPWLNGQLQIIQPKLIITLGVVAFEQVRQETFPKLGNVHGKPMYWDSPYNRRDTRVLATYHPSAALRGSPKYKRIILEDLMKLQNPDWARPLEECYICGAELHRYDGWGIGLCERHCIRQGSLFPESAIS